MARPRSCSILVLNYNGKPLLERYLPSVLAARRHADVIVVDNASTDGGPELAERLGARVMRRQRNEFLMSLNFAAQRLGSEVLVMLNNDLEVEPDFLAPLLEHFDDPSVCSTGCKILDPDRQRVQMARTQGHFCHGKLEPVYLIEQLLEPDRLGPQPTLYTPGGACAVDRLKYLELGGFHPLLYPIYSEDVDLGYAAWRRGWRNLYDPRSVVIHQHAATTSRLFTQEWLDRHKLKNKLMVSWKNVSDRGILGEFARTCLYLARRGLQEGRPWQARAVLQLLARYPAVQRYRSALETRGIVPDRAICNVFNQPSEPTLVGYHRT